MNVFWSNESEFSFSPLTFNPWLLSIWFLLLNKKISRFSCINLSLKWEMNRKIYKTPEQDSSVPSIQSITPLQYLYDSMQRPSDRHIISSGRHDVVIFPDGWTKISWDWLILKVCGINKSKHKTNTNELVKREQRGQIWNLYISNMHLG